MKNKKKILSAAVAAGMVLSLLTACSGTGSKTASGESGSVQTSSANGKGRYVETNLGNPFKDDSSDAASETASESAAETETGTDNADLYGSSISCMTTLKDGTQKAVTQDSSGGYKIYSSKDNGKTWTDLNIDFSSIGGFSSNSDDSNTSVSKSMSTVSIDGQGDVFFDYDVLTSNADSGDEAHTYYLLSSDGKFSKLDFELPNVPKTQHYDYTEDESAISDSSSETGETDDGIVINESGESTTDDGGLSTYSGYLNSAKLIDSGHIYIAVDSNIFLVSLKDNKIEKTITDLDYVQSMAVCGDSLIAVSYNKSIIYNAQTGEKTAELKKFSNIIAQARSSVIIGDNFSSNDIYYVDSDGVYKFDTKTENSTQIIDGALTSLIDPNIFINAFSVCSDGTFLICFTNNSGQVVCSYAYDSEIAAKPDKQITIYALSDNYTFRQVAAGFQKANPDIYVTYEFGMTGDNAVTLSDAMRTLNTEIMGGNGPDVILLDGLSVNNYISKGVFADVSDIVQPLIDSGKLFKNQASAYKQKDGSIPAVPMTFTYPMIIGDKDYISKISSISDLAAAAEKFSKTNTNSKVTFMQSYSLSSLLMAVMPVCSNWYNTDGTLNSDAVKSTLEGVKKIYDASYSCLSDDDKSSVDSMIEYYTSDEAGDIDISSGSSVSDPTSDAMYITAGVNKVALGYMASSDSLQNVTSAMKADDKLTYTSMPGSGGKIFVPNNIIGINAKSKDLDTAKSFLSYLLSTDGQNAFSQQYSGFPVNTESFDKSLVNPYKGQDWYDPKEPVSSMGMEDQNGKDYTLDIYWPTDAEIADFKKKVSNLDTASSKDNTVMNTIFKDSINYIAGKNSIDDTMTKIQKDIKIYLAE